MLSSIPTKSYDEYITHCADITTRNAVRAQLGLTPASCRIFLAAFAFRYYPHEFIEGGVTALDRQQIISAIVLTRAGEALFTASAPDATVLAQFQAQLATYSVNFRQWLKVNELRTAHPFILRYRQLRRLRDQADTEGCYYTRELKQLVDLSYLQLISMINSIGGEAALATIDQLTDIPEDAVFDTELRSAAATAYWAGFRERLPCYEPVIALLVDFVHSHMRLIPHNSARLAQLTEVLDIEFIREKLAREVISLEDLKGYLRFILAQTVEIGAPADETVIHTRYDAIIDAPSRSSDAGECVVTLLEAFFIPLFAYYEQLAITVAAARASTV